MLSQILEIQVTLKIGFSIYANVSPYYALSTDWLQGLFVYLAAYFAFCVFLFVLGLFSMDCGQNN